MLNQVALVSQTKHVTTAEVNVVAAALQKQVTRDFGPIWNVQATVSPFDELQHVPVGYWPIIIRDDIQQQGAAGYHTDKNGQPLSLVQYDTNWALTTSHECLEMLADPFGNRTVTGDSLKTGQGRVQYLVEVCDPCEDAKLGYTLNGVLLSDFYTPNFFDPVAAAGVRYSFNGGIKAPRQVLNGGYISWYDPVSQHVFQMFVMNGKKTISDLGSSPGGFSLREFADRAAEKRRGAVEHRGAPRGIMLTAMVAKSQGAPKPTASVVDKSSNAYADSIEKQVARILKRR
jgi:hypothetical protein